jgi:hypothetical protein
MAPRPPRRAAAGNGGATDGPTVISSGAGAWARLVAVWRALDAAGHRRPVAGPVARPETAVALPPPAAGADPTAQSRDEAARIDPPPALLMLAERLGLTDFERDTLLLAAAAEIDPGIAALYAQVQGGSRGAPTFALALQALPDASWDALSPHRPLRYARLVEPIAGGTAPLVATPLRADERIVHYLKGLNVLDDRLSSLLAPAGRYLLAHEAAHAAQRTLTATSHRRVAAHAAEAEAAAAGRAFAAGRLPDRPRIALVTLRAAADVGVKDAVEAPPVVDVAMVRVSRAREIAAIKSSLGGLWVSDGDVFDVLEILDRIPYPIVHTVLMALEDKERYWLADNINPPHVYRFRKLVLACYDKTLPDAPARRGRPEGASRDAGDRHGDRGDRSGALGAAAPGRRPAPRAAALG